MSLFYAAQKHPPRHTVERRYPVARFARTSYLGWIPPYRSTGQAKNVEHGMTKCF